MAVSKAQKRAQEKYNAKTYEQILFRVKKGKKEEYKQAAEMRGIGFHEMLRRGADEYIINHPVDKQEEG